VRSDLKGVMQRQQACNKARMRMNLKVLSSDKERTVTQMIHLINVRNVYNVKCGQALKE
jgi:hypothetical protein